MSLEQLKSFITKAKDSDDILGKLKEAKSPEEVAAIAKEHGHEFSSGNFSTDNLTEMELEGLSGGLEVLWTSYCKK